jgi:hypothetical protein
MSKNRLRSGKSRPPFHKSKKQDRRKEQVRKRARRVSARTFRGRHQKRPTKRNRILRRQKIADPRIARALGYMRREGISASEGARREKMKLRTFQKGAGRYLYRTSPGKPWRARNDDHLRFLMSILTSQGPLDVVVSKLTERKLLHQYDLALRMFRAGADGAEAALKAFEGKTVGGHTLVTDIKLLIVLEEAGQLDFEHFYVPVGGRS